MDEQLRQRLLTLQKIPGMVGRPGLLPLGIPAIDEVLGGGGIPSAEAIDARFHAHDVVPVKV